MTGHVVAHFDVLLSSDHHELLQAQCVGAHNLRHFLLFLLFTVVGCCYAFGLAVALLQFR